MVMCGRASEPPALPRSGLRPQHRPTHRTAALAQPWGAASRPRVSPVASAQPPPCGKPLPPILCFPWLDTLLGSVLTRLLQSEPWSLRHGAGCEGFVLAFASWLPHKLHKIRGLICSSHCL